MRLFELFDTYMEELEGQKQKRLEFIVNTYGPKWKPIPPFKEIKPFIEKLGELDPTRNGAYMQWMAKLIIKDPTVNKTEDLHRMAGDLRTFEENKSKIANKDINSYKSFEELYNAIEPFTRPRELTKAEKAEKEQEEQLAKIKNELIDVYSGPEGWIKIPTTVKASNHIGKYTRWCTVGDNHNMFSHYSKSDRLIVIYDRNLQKRFQLHIDSNQFADEADHNHGMKAVPEWARPHIISWYKKNVKGLNMKHIMTFADFGDEHAAKGTDHEEVMELLKKYGVIGK